MGEKILEKTICFHCGEECEEDLILFEEKSFCCLGCKGVYSILNSCNLGNYYVFNDHPGSQQIEIEKHFEYLSEPSVIRDLIDFQDESITWVHFYIPNIHCSSCLWLLENLHKIHPGIIQCRVDFLKKEASIRFDHHVLSLQELVQLLNNIGYEPLIQFQDLVREKKEVKKDSLILKIAVAGFCFGNVMLLSFPEYFGLEGKTLFRSFFGLLNALFCLPIVFYSGWDYFTSAWKTLKNGSFNLDLPLALGITVLFIRTLFEIASHTGAGFADTLCGLVFFLLIGKWVQKKTYHHISFERDYRSFFPVAVMLMTDHGDIPIPLTDLKTGHRILVRNNEIIPADSILLKGEAQVDFSFVTGESVPVSKTLGEIIYAGGRQTGQALELEVIKPVSQSYLTSLWNHEAFKTEKKNAEKTFSEKVSQYFTPILLVLAFFGFLYWIPSDSTRAWMAFSSVLIIACPCALALSTPFTLASALSIFDKNHFYLKNISVVEHMARINTLVLDKTGTLTLSQSKNMDFHGFLDPEQEKWVYSACMNSLHPLSRMICQYLGNMKRLPVQEFSEIPGSGFIAKIEGRGIKIGSAEWVLGISDQSLGKTQVHVEVDKNYMGFFSIAQEYRKGMENLKVLEKDYSLFLLSGDQNFEEEHLKSYFSRPNTLYFNQSPLSKMNFIESLQNSGSRVIMLGDGLNDSGALRNSDLGIAITDHVNNFSPGCDALMEGSSFPKLPAFLKFSQDAVRVIHLSFGISLIYNLVGLSFALSGKLSPLVAAILMPLSTITIISFTTLATHYAAKKRNLL